MNFIDKTVAFFSPESAVKREHARRKLQVMNSSGYAEHGASSTKKSLIGWTSRAGSPDEDIVFNSRKLRYRSRDLFMGSPIAAAAIKTMRTNVVGAGLRLNASIDYDLLGMTPEEADKWETNTEREFALWANNQNCDATRYNTFGKLQGLAFISMLMSGDSFVLLPKEKRKGVPYDLRVRLIEADRICNPYNIPNFNLKILEGVEIGDYGEPVAYHLAKYHPLSTRTIMNTWTRIEAFGAKSGRRNILHLMDQERPEQRRGVPILAPVIESLKQLSRYTEAELVAAVVSGMYAVFIKTDTGQVNLGESPIPYEDQVDQDDPASYELGNGSIMALGPNESIQEANPGRPNTAFDGFVMSIMRQIGTALEIPFELLIKHFTASYSASRAALLEAWKMFRMRREWLANEFCQPIYEEWLAEAIAKGRISAPGFFGDPLIRAAWCGAEWIGPAPGQVDPVKEANAAILRIDACLSTRAKEATEMTGMNYEKIVRQRIREENERKEGGLVVDPTVFASPKNLNNQKSEGEE